MTLRKKWLMATFLALALMLLFLRYSLYSAVRNGFLRIEGEQAQRRVQRALDSLAFEIDGLQQKVADWTAGNNVARLVEVNDKSALSARLSDESLAQLRIHVAILVGPNGVPIATGARDPQRSLNPADRQRLIGNILARRDLLMPAVDFAPRSGLLMTTWGPMLATIRPIMSRQSPGTHLAMVGFAQLLNEQMVQRVSSVAHLPLAFHRFGAADCPPDVAAAGTNMACAGQTVLTPINDDTLRGYAMVYDMKGRPALILTTDMDRVAYRQARSSLRYLMGGLIGAGLTFALLSVLFCERLILGRLLRMGAALRRIGETADRSARLEVRGDDELSAVARSANTMLDALQKSDSELIRHREQLEQLVADRTAQLVVAEKQVMLNERLASVGQLAAGVAHEINTPIQYVGDNLRALSTAFDDLTKLVEQYRSLGELVRQGTARPDAVAPIAETEQKIDLPFLLEDTGKAITQGLDGVQRVAGIVKAMKEFSHVDGGRRSAVNLNQAVQTALTVARNEYKYVADVKTELGELPTVPCYAGELNQVILNLIVNAAHAIADTKQRGTITVRTASEGEMVCISIADTGTGIPPEIQQKIFDPFFTTKGVGKGTGQGLAIAHQIVVGKHKGKIAFESQVGKGTTFFIRIPIQVAEPDPAGETAPLKA